MKLYIWTLDYCNRHGGYDRTITGIVKAESEDTAKDAVWQKYCSDYAYNLCVSAVPMDALSSGTPITI